MLESGIAIACGLAIILPLWLVPVLVTGDGPSHLYNAIVAHAVRQGLEPYRLVHSWDAGWLAPNRAAQTILMLLGPSIGWESAERVLLSLSVVGTYLLVLLHLRGTAGATSLRFAPIAAWFSQHWFAWMGFYDFSLSIVAFLLLLLSLRRSRGLTRVIAIQVLLPLIYLSHLFTFAVSVGAVLWTSAWRVWKGVESRWHVLAGAPGVLLLLGGYLFGGAGGGGGIGWEGRLKAIAGLFIGDYLVSLHAVDLVASVLIMALLWLAAARVARHFSSLPTDLQALALFAVLLLCASLLGPDRIGGGSYISARLRIFAALAFLPIFAREAGGWMGWVVRGTLIGTLLIQGGWAIRASRRAGEDLATIERLLTEAGAARGQWIRTALTDSERGLFRISGYLHLAERAAYRGNLVVLDNYEAPLSIFPVNWIRPPDGLQLEESDGRLVASIIPRAETLIAPVYVIHEADRTIVAGEAGCLVIDSTRRAGAFAVTPVRWCGP